MLTASITLHRKPKDGTDGVTYEIQLDTDSVVLDSATKQFVTHKLGDVHFMYHQGSYIEDMTMRIIDTFSYIILYYGYEAKKDENGKPVLGSDGKPVMEYKAITYSSNEGVTDIWNTMQMNVGDDASCYGMKYIWYDKNLPDDDEVMFEKIWSELEGIPPKELGIKILATKMFTVRREADSVQSSDVVFGIGTKTQQPTAWITNFGGLTLAEGKYVWTCTKTTLTNGTTYYTGAYCLGECYDFAHVEELYALSDSSTQAPESGWSYSYKPVKGKYLWSCVKVTYNDANISYLNQKCVSYFPNDGVNGTKFTPKGTAYGHYTASSKMPKPSDDVLGLLYLVDKVDTTLKSINSPCVAWWRSISAGSYILAYDAAEEGDAYNVDGTLWVHNGTVWKDFGSIQGPKGDDGEDALNIELSVEKILFSYDKNDFDTKSKIVTLIVRQGGNVIKPSEYNVKIIAAQNFDINPGNNNIAAVKKDTYCTITCYAKGVTFYSYSYDNNETSVRYPASSCSIKIAVEYNGITYFKELSIEVSFVKMYGGLNWDIEHLSSTFGKLTAGYDGTLAQMESKVTQNAENIALKVSQTYYDDNNKKVDERFSTIEQNVNNIKLEVSATSNGLKTTGIDITNGSITMTANKFKLYNNNKDEVFSADENGNGVFKGKVTATSGYIGGLEIYDDSYEFGGQTFNYKGLMYQNMEYVGYMPNHSINLNDRYIYIGYGDSGFGGVFYAGNKPNSITSADGQSELLFDAFLVAESHTDNSVTGQSSMAERLVATCNASGNATALEANAHGGKENYAVDALNGDIRAQNGDFRADNGNFYAEKGAFIGVHRGNVTKIDRDCTLQKTASTIICINKNKDITINLPSDAEPGTFYRIIKRGNPITVKSETMNISFVSYGDVVYSVSSGKKREWINCFWDGEYWYVEMSGN